MATPHSLCLLSAVLCLTAAAPLVTEEPGDVSVRTALEARSDGRVDGVLRLERGGVRALYAGRRSAEGELLHRIGVATPPAILGPVSPKGLLAFALDPTGLPGALLAR